MDLVAGLAGVKRILKKYAKRTKINQPPSLTPFVSSLGRGGLISRRTAGVSSLKDSLLCHQDFGQLSSIPKGPCGMDIFLKNCLILGEAIESTRISDAKYLIGHESKDV